MHQMWGYDNIYKCDTSSGCLNCTHTVCGNCLFSVINKDILSTKSKLLVLAVAHADLIARKLRAIVQGPDSIGKKSWWKSWQKSWGKSNLKRRHASTIDVFKYLNIFIVTFWWEVCLDFRQHFCQDLCRDFSPIESGPSSATPVSYDFSEFRTEVGEKEA